MDNISAIQARNSNSFDAKAITQQALVEHQEKLAGAQGAAQAAAQSGITPVNDVTALTDEAVQAIAGKADAGAGDVDNMMKALKEYIDGKLETGDSVQNDQQNPNKAQQGAGKKKETEIEVEFNPLIDAKTIQAPGDAIGEFNVTKKEKESEAVQPAGGASESQSANASGASSADSQAGQVGASDSAATAGSQKAGEATTDSDSASEESGAAGVSGVEGSTKDDKSEAPKVKMSAQAAEAMKEQMNRGQSSAGVGTVKDSNGAEVAIPENGGTLRTEGWEQSIWVNDGGKIEGGEKLEEYRKLDDSNSGMWMEEHGKNTDEVADKFEKQSIVNPQGSDASTKAQEVEKLRNPTPTEA